MGLFSKALGLERKGSISIDFGNQSYYAGGLVSGTIRVTADEPIKCDALVLKASGKEFAQWAENRNGQTRMRSKKHTIFSDKVVIVTFTEAIEPGTYTYPFEYQLPQDLPGVFSLQDYGATWVKGVNADISYTLKATVDVSGFLVNGLTAKHPVAIYERVRDGLPVSEGSITKNVRYFALMYKGACTLSVKLDRNAYQPGDTVHVQCTIENKSEVDISAVRCKLAQVLTIRGAKCKQNLIKYDCPGVTAGATQSQTYAVELRALGNLPELVATSSCGKTNKCEYRIKVECDIAMCPDVVLRLPVRLAW